MKKSRISIANQHWHCEVLRLKCTSNQKKKAAAYLVSDIWGRMNLGVFVSNVRLWERGEVVSVLEDILEACIHKT